MSEPPKETGTLIEHKPGFRHTEAQIHDGLTAVALWNGSTRKAAEQLAEEGRPIPETTLRHWRDDSQVETYHRIREGVQDRIWQRTASRWHRVAEDAADGAREAVALTRTALQGEDVRDAKELSVTAKNLAFAGGIASDKSAMADGRPTVIREVHDISTTVKALGRYLPQLKDSPLANAIDSTAVEVGTESVPRSPRGP